MLMSRPARPVERAFVSTPTEVVDLRVEKGVVYADPKDPVAIDMLQKHHGFTPVPEKPKKAAPKKKAAAKKPAAKKAAAKKAE